MKRFSCIAALTKNWGIGANNQLPWRKFAVDMEWFREKTLNQTVIMGRGTLESMGWRTLPKRQNYVLSRQGDQLDHRQAKYFRTLDEALAASTTREVYVIGGQQIYELAIQHPRCQNVYLTHTSVDVPSDRFFPKLPASDYYLKQVIQTGTEPVYLSEADEATDVKFEILEYARRPTAKIISCYQNNQGEAGYLQALRDIIDHGETRADRTGVGTRSLFGISFRYDLQKGFPLLTTKKMFTRGIFEELLWFLRGETDAKVLQAKNIHIWDGNTSREYLNSRGLNHLEEGDIGAGYGFQFRHSGAQYVDCHTDYSGQGFDQVQYILDMIRNKPESRKILLNLWNPSDISKMALEPCHLVYHFWVSKGQYLNCAMYQRSADMGLGVPFNIASASLMTHLFAKLTSLEAGEFVHHIGDAHIYLNHIEALETQLTRTPKPFPRLEIVDRGQNEVADFQVTDFVIRGYHPDGPVKMEMAV